MYKVLIADDENLVIESLKGSIAWSHYGFQVVAQANNGISAMELINQTRPDFVLTDIRMPGIGGLELIQMAKRQYPDMLFAILSGFAEFSYAQRAIKYGIEEYCLKPFEESEIAQILERAKKKLDLQRAAKPDIFRLLEIENENKGDAEGLGSYLKWHGLDITREMMVLVIGGHAPDRLFAAAESAVFSIGSDKYVIITQTEGISDTLTKNDEHPRSFRVGIGGNTCRLSEMPNLIERANIAYYHNFLNPGAVPIFEFVPEQTDVLNKHFYALYDSIAENDSKRSREQLEDIQKLFEHDYANIKSAYRLYHSVLTRSNSEEPAFEFIYGFDDLVSRYADVSEMIHALHSLCSNGGCKPVFERAAMETGNESMKKMLDHVHKHLNEASLSLQSLSRSFYLNASYISQLFRKETGKTFTEYTTSLRMQYARDLLQNAQSSVQAVSEQVGYTDYFYFSKLFKKAYGISPSQIRHMDHDS